MRGWRMFESTPRMKINGLGVDSSSSRILKKLHPEARITWWLGILAPSAATRVTSEKSFLPIRSRNLSDAVDLKSSQSMQNLPASVISKSFLVLKTKLAKYFLQRNA